MSAKYRISENGYGQVIIEKLVHNGCVWNRIKTDAAQSLKTVKDAERYIEKLKYHTEMMRFHVVKEIS